MKTADEKLFGKSMI